MRARRSDGVGGVGWLVVCVPVWGEWVPEGGSVVGGSDEGRGFGGCEVGGFLVCTVGPGEVVLFFRGWVRAVVVCFLWFVRCFSFVDWSWGLVCKGGAFICPVIWVGIGGVFFPVRF